MKVSAVNSTGDSFYWNYVTDTFYSNYAGAVIKVAVSVAIMQLEVSATYAGENFCSKYVSDTFYWNYASGSLCCDHAGGISYSALCRWLSIVIMQVIVSIVAMYVTASSSNFIFLSLTDIHFP